MPKVPRKLPWPITQESLMAHIELVSKALDSLVNFGETFTNAGTFTAASGGADHSDIECWKTTGTTPAGANTEFAVAHNLPRIPIHFIYTLDRAGDIYTYYAGMTAWTAATSAGLDGNIYLKCSVASANYRIIIF